MKNLWHSRSFGPKPIEAALALGVPAERINTITTVASVYGVREVGRRAVHPLTIEAGHLRGKVVLTID